MANGTRVNAASVEQLARLVGVPIPADQLDVAATRLQEMFDIDEILVKIDLTGVEPSAVYDPSWDGESGA